MLLEKAASLHRYIGRHLLDWVVAKADVWFLLYRCVDLVAQVHSPLDGSARTLYQLLQLDDEDEDTEDEIENNEHAYLDCLLRASCRWRPVRRTG